ncbi:hypothetical protein C6341_g23766 [Phytophthora cactorum]|nr:hypothetical protein C6341_g23766 [Phytophthora cactorum]
MAKVDNTRNDFLQHAEDLAHLGQAWELEPVRHRNLGKEVVAAVGERRSETRRCHECNQIEHLRSACPVLGRGRERGPDMMLAVGKKVTEADDMWIIDNEKGYTLTYRDGQRVVAAKDGENAAFDVGLWRSVLIVQGSVERKREPAADVIMAALEQGVNPANDASDAVQKGTLVEFQKRMDHLTYDHVDRLASGPSSGIELTDHRRVNCLTCAQGKQTKN